MMFQTENDCFEYLKKINKFIFKGGRGCNGTYDNIMCFEATPANVTLELPCPKMTGVFDETKTLFKTCLPNSEWEGINKTGMHSGHTNYDLCLTEASLKEFNMHTTKNYDLILNLVLYGEVIGISLSILCILFSLSIFMYHKSLRCKRTKIHLNLFVAILFQSILRLAFFIDRLLYDPTNPNSLSYTSRVHQYSNKICPIGMAFLEYFQCCNFMWMLCEGIYLNVLLSYSIFDNGNQALILVFYFVGWVLPAVAVGFWFTSMYNIFGYDEVCWFGYYEKPVYWIIQGPILLALIVNIFCLINVIRILTVKLRENGAANRENDSINQIKKSFKAAALLLPLLGVTHLFEMYHGQPSHWILNLMYSVINCILVFFNGVFLSILYCFMNNEVKNVIKRHWLSRPVFKRFGGVTLNRKGNMSLTNDNKGLLGETELNQLKPTRSRMTETMDTETMAM